MPKPWKNLVAMVVDGVEHRQDTPITLPGRETLVWIHILVNGSAMNPTFGKF
jgi:hypothetical protein